MLRQVVAIALISALVSWVALWTAMKIAESAELLDKPNHRKRHARPVPLIGGVGLILTLAVCGLLGLFWGGLRWPAYGFGLGVALSIIFIVGLVDDRKPIKARTRLVAQVIASISVVALGGTLVRSLGDVFFPLPIGLSFFSFPFTVVAVVGVVNAFNMSDGSDGLCGGYGLSSLVWMLVCAALLALSGGPASVLFFELIPIIIPTLCMVFFFLLLYNYRMKDRKSAKAFLGDSGSMALGLIVVWLTIRLNGGYSGDEGVPAVTLLCIVAVPLADMFASMYRRVVVARVPLLEPDRKHVHHLLEKMGLSQGHAVNVLVVANAVFGLIGVISWQVGMPQYVVFWSLVVAFFVYLKFYLNKWESIISDEIKKPGWGQENQVPRASSSCGSQPVDVVK